MFPDSTVAATSPIMQMRSPTVMEPLIDGGSTTESQLSSKIISNDRMNPMFYPMIIVLESIDNAPSFQSTFAAFHFNNDIALRVKTLKQTILVIGTYIDRRQFIRIARYLWFYRYERKRRERFSPDGFRRHHGLYRLHV